VERSISGLSSVIILIYLKAVISLPRIKIVGEPSKSRIIVPDCAQHISRSACNYHVDRTVFW